MNIDLRDHMEELEASFKIVHKAMIQKGRLGLIFQPVLVPDEEVPWAYQVWFPTIDSDTTFVHVTPDGQIVEVETINAGDFHDHS